MTAKRKVALIGTGGTISSEGRSNLDLYDYPENGRKLQADELLAKFPEAGLAAEVVPVRFRAVGSPDIGPAEWLDLVRMVHELATDDVGVVRQALVSHGDWLEHS